MATKPVSLSVLTVNGESVTGSSFFAGEGTDWAVETQAAKEAATVEIRKRAGWAGLGGGGA